MGGELKPCSAMCATCPWREGSEYSYLVEYLTEQSLITSRVCHSTGRSAVHPGGTKKPRRICRGSRDFQLRLLHRLGMIDAPTDEAWERAWEKLKQTRPMKPSVKTTRRWSDAQRYLMERLPQSGEWVRVPIATRSSTVRSLIDRGDIEHRKNVETYFDEWLSMGWVRLAQNNKQMPESVLTRSDRPANIHDEQRITRIDAPD